MLHSLSLRSCYVGMRIESLCDHTPLLCVQVLGVMQRYEALLALPSRVRQHAEAGDYEQVRLGLGLRALEQRSVSRIVPGVNSAG